MLIVLSAGMLAGLTATLIQLTPTFAYTNDCIGNGDNSCNEVKDGGQSITQHDCEIKNGGSDNTNGEKSDNFRCDNFLGDPNTGG